MRTIMMVLSSALLFGGAACKKSDTEKAEKEMQKAQEKVDDRREDIADEQKDVREEQKDLAEEQKDVDEKRGELAVNEANLKVAQDNLMMEGRSTMSRIDAKLEAASKRTDKDVQEKLGDMRVKRAELETKISQAGTRTAANWNEFKEEVTEDMTKLEKDLDDLLD
jgi:DNA repair exonuclease SbcCD ATPase subunit